MYIYDLKIGYDLFIILFINFEIFKGDYIVIIGLNGVGKIILIKIIVEK